MTQEVLLKRVQCHYKDENARFLLECDFSKQYSNYYRKRLEKTKPFVEFNCRSKWNSNIPIYSLAELATSTSCDIDDLEQVFSSPTLSSPEEAALPTFEFPKRMRKSSDSFKESPQLGNSSTQLDGKKSNTNIFQSSLFESPILPPNNTASQPCTQDSSQKQQFQECIVIGTIFKRMKLQPNVVRELSQGDFHVKCERYLGHYTSQDDNLVLEDTTESISLIGNIDPGKFVTGIVVGLLGIAVDGGSQFLVQDICYAEPNRQVLYDDEDDDVDDDYVDYVGATISQESSKLSDSTNEPIYLMVISCLGFRHDMKKDSHQTRALQSMINFIWGGGNYADDERSSRVARILVVGDSLLEDRLYSQDKTDESDENILTKMKQSRQVKQYDKSIRAVNHMDDFFAQLSKTINVDVMPGPSDPSSHLMPQQPFHPCMFPKSCMFPTFNCVTNPYRAIYNRNIEVLATSGQNVDIISKFSDLTDPIEIMKCHLMWGNSAPSAPDNLYSVPYEDDDPHVIDFIPEIYITGTQESYKTDYYYYNLGEPTVKRENKKSEEALFTTPDKESSHTSKNITSTSIKKSRTLLITVPKFCNTYECVLINLKDLKSHLISFKEFE